MRSFSSRVSQLIPAILCSVFLTLLPTTERAHSIELVRSELTVGSTGTAQSQTAEAVWVEENLTSLSLDQKIGQLIIPATVGMFLPEGTEEFQRIKRNITEFHVGGYHLLGDNNVVREPVGAALLVNHLQQLSRIPLLITADLEGGAGFRYSGATRLPRAMAIGATANEDLAMKAGRVAGEEARAIGVNVNFYPVVDINNNPRNPIINIRSFGGDPGLVSRMARAYIRGLQSTGVMSTAKHFPGHGDTSVDSHMQLPVLEVDRGRLESIEIAPFRAAIQEGVGGVMSAHIALPQIDSSRLPATLSSKILTDLLRGEMGFKGLVFTDAMNMNGIVSNYHDGEAAVLAVRAGADIILYPPDVEKAFTALKQAVKSEVISESRIDESVRRILAAKFRVGLNKNRITDLSELDRKLASSEHLNAAREIMENAITLVKDTGNVLPLKLTPEHRVLLVTMVDGSDGWREGPPGRAFHNALSFRQASVTPVQVSERTGRGEYDLIKSMASLCDVVIVNAFIRIAAYKGSIEMGPDQLDLLKHLSTLEKPFAFVLYGSPYLISSVPSLPTYVLAYEYHPGAEEAALRALLGDIEFRGRLPVSLPGLYPSGHSATRPDRRSGRPER